MTTLLHDRIHASPVMPQRVCVGRAPYHNGCRWWKGICNWPGSNWCVRCHREVWDPQTTAAPEGNGMCANGCHWTPCAQAGGCDRIGFPDSLLEWSCGFHVDGFGRGHTTTDTADPNPCVGGG